MKDAHFHFRTAPVSRGRGHSAVAAAAYQANQELTHVGQRQCSIHIKHRKELNKGMVTEALRHDFALSGIELTDGATAHKDGRRYWTITDGDACYTVREFAERATNKKTGKREVTRRVLDIYADKQHNYTSKEDVQETWVQLPTHSPDWMKEIAARKDAIEKEDRQALWNAVEDAETARDGRTARKFEVSFIRELSYTQNKTLVMEFVREQFTRKGLIVDVAVHAKQASDGLPNIHVHILTSTREIERNGAFVTTKNAYWNKRERVKEWRAAWAVKLNRALEAAGSDVRADPRSYEARGLNKEPQEHMGYQAWHLEQKGIETAKGNQNREIHHDNAVREIVQGAWADGHANDYEPAEERTTEPAAFSPALSSETQHRQTLRQTIRATSFRTLQANVELITRMETYGRAFVEKARELGQTIFDRFASWTDRETAVQQRKQRTRGHER